MKLSALFLATAACIACIACSQPSDQPAERESTEDNVLIDYIERPKNKALDAREAVEAVDTDRRRQLEAFDDQ